MADRAPAGAAETPTVERLAGASRIQTAIKVSEDGYPGGAPAVALARADDYADALTGGPLAAQLGGPILLTSQDELSPEVAEEIRRLKPSYVALLGGSSALSAEVQNDLHALGVATVERFGGRNRFDTARLIAEAVLERSGADQAYLALGGHDEPGRGWPDAVAVSGLAAATGRPILLTSQAGLPDATRDLLAGGDLQSVAIVGGPAAVPDDVDDSLRQMGLAVSRLAGQTRYHTSVVVSESALAQGASASPLWLVTGRNFPDALTAGPAVAASGGVLLLVDPPNWDGHVARNWLIGHTEQISQLMVVGGSSAISFGLEDDARALLGAAPRADASTALAATRLGLHVSAEELAVWRERSKSGPYRSAGDVSANSPGDWLRIADEAEAFKDDPGQALWSGPTVLDSGCAIDAGTDNDPPREGPSRLRDAAFYYLVTGDASYRDPVKAMLLEQAAEPRLDFSDRGLWCRGVIHDGHPSFPIANWMTQLLYAYDYLGADSFTAAERAALNSWFYEAATFWTEDANADLDKLFADRWNGDYTLTSTGNSTSNPRVGYYGSKPIYPIHRYYNNRRACVYRFAAAAAVKLADEGYTADGAGSKLTVGELRKSAKLWVTEWLAYSVFEEGFFGEFERWTADNPDLGLNYAAKVLGSTATIADVLARAGDPELIDYATTAGAKGTASSQPKTLLTAMHALAGYVDGAYTRYGTDQASRNGDPAYRLDGINGDWHSIQDIYMTPLNIHYQDPHITAIYTRTAPGAPAYPAKPAASHYIVWTTDWGTYPGTMLMFGQME